MNPTHSQTYNVISAIAAHAVTPDTPFAHSPIGIYVGTGGDVIVKFASGGPNVTFTGVPSGSILPVRAYVVVASGTTATNMVALY